MCLVSDGFPDGLYLLASGLHSPWVLRTHLRYGPSMPRPWYNVVNLLAAQSMQRCKERLKRGSDWLVTFRSCSDVTMVRKYPLVLQLRISGVSCSTIAPRLQRSEFVVNFLDTRCEAKHHIQIAKQDAPSTRHHSRSETEELALKVPYGANNLHRAIKPMRQKTTAAFGAQTVSSAPKIT